MFEDALVESAGRLKTHSKYWTLGTFALNGGLLAILILMPLLYPEALPAPAIAAMLIAPAPPPAPAPMPAAAAVQRVQCAVALHVPSIIPQTIVESVDPPSVPATGVQMGPQGPGESVAGNDILSVVGPLPVITVVKPKPVGPVRISSGVEAGNLIVKTDPVYPAIARAAHVSGTVVLRAMISKTGMIENLTVQSGPVMLRQAALDGVRNWRYRPFLLNGEATDVDTTITVNFTND